MPTKFTSRDGCASEQKLKRYVHCHEVINVQYCIQQLIIIMSLQYLSRSSLHRYSIYSATFCSVDNYTSVDTIILITIPHALSNTLNPNLYCGMINLCFLNEFPAKINHTIKYKRWFLDYLSDVNHITFPGRPYDSQRKRCLQKIVRPAAKCNAYKTQAGAGAWCGVTRVAPTRSPHSSWLRQPTSVNISHTWSHW